MSDDEYYDDDDEYLDFDGSPFNEAEDLAAHTVQSPVFVNYDPSWETASFASDWEYYSDEYWEGPLKKRKPKEESIEGAEATIGTKGAKKKLKEGKPNGISCLSLGEPSLAGSTVVWKSRKETLEPYGGPVINDGQGEKVSLLTDWKERFKLPSVTTPEAGQRIGKQKAVTADAGSLSLKEHCENILPAPPTTLEELKGLPSGSRVIPARPRELALGTDGTAAYPSSDEGSNLDEDASERNNAIESYVIQRVIAVEIPNQDAVFAPRPGEMPGRPKKEQRHDLKDGNRSEGDLEAHVRIATSNRKRKADNGSSSSDGTTEVPNRNIKQGRPKKQRSTSSEQGQLALSAGAAPPPGKRKPGRPKKQKPSPLSEGFTRRDFRTCATPINKEGPVNPTCNDPIQPGPVNGLGLHQEKRKVSDSEDELSMPPLKRQHNVKKEASMKEVVARRSTRKKLT